MCDETTQDEHQDVPPESDVLMPDLLEQAEHCAAVRMLIGNENY